MAGPRQGSGVRIALIDDDSGLITVLDRRLVLLGWTRTVLTHAPAPDELAALKLSALIVNPALAGPDYVGWVADALPGLALLVVSGSVAVAERVIGLRSGADDWITKPCHPDELVARIEAVLRRRRTGDLPDVQATILAGELAIRPDRFDAYAHDRAASLSRKEYELLRLIAAADGRVLRREEIYEAVWGYTMARGDRSVDVFVRKLRTKLAEISPEWSYVHTHFGVGYRFAAEGPDGTSAPAESHPLPAGARTGPASRAGGRSRGGTLTV
jgi:DNA-binding response OmpR family regulator